MISAPEVHVRVRLNESEADRRSRTDGYVCELNVPVGWEDRVQGILGAWTKRFPNSSLPISTLELIYNEPAHQGLGSGTQVSCLVAAALWEAHRRTLNKVDALGSTNGSLDVAMLSRLSLRGLRSHIGLSGFLEGGLIYDPGRSIPEEEPFAGSVNTSMSARSIERIAFPDWPILLIQNHEFTGEHGDAEKLKFQQCADSPNFNRERMLELIVEDLLPAAKNRDWNRWDRCIGEYGHLAGLIFHKVQSGVFRSQAIKKVVERLHELGCQGACQSSWGPTVAVAARDLNHAEDLRSKMTSDFPSLTIRITHAMNSGATVSDVGSS